MVDDEERDPDSGVLAALDEVIGPVADDLDGEPSPIVIVHAPRAGSTLLYQLFVLGAAVDYLPNLVNGLTPTTPLVGLALRAGVGAWAPVSYGSRFGKTEGPWGPSEASNVHVVWFGGGHPSEVVSSNFCSPAAAAAMRRTLQGARGLSGAELVLKNAWNSFRIQAIAEEFPSARFVWLRRDVREAASSDLLARWITKGDLESWNSATPARVEDLRRLEPWHQCVENQLAFAQSISAALSGLDPHRWVSVWYEDLVTDPSAVMGSLCQRLGVTGVHRCSSIWRASRDARRLPAPDRPAWFGEARDTIREHVAAAPERYAITMPVPARGGRR